MGDGLILRRAIAADAEALAAFNANIHRDSDTQPPEERVAAWVRDLLTRPHPTFDAGDFTIVDLPDFLWLIAPVLEQRLAESELVGHSAELKITFYRGGLRLVLDHGRIAAVEPWTPAPREEVSARFPDLTFLQLLFGYRALEELEYAHADCGVNGDVWALFQVLFPKRASNIWAVN